MRESGSPHDALFKFVFSEPEHARGILQTALPPAIASRIDWASLTLHPSGLVDDELSQRCTDLLFGARVDGRDARVLVLFEHQSRSDAWMPLRLLEYTIRIWNDWRRDHPGISKLPAVIPVVLHYSERGWRGPTELLELLDLDASTRQVWAPHLPNLRFVLDDLPAQSDDAIRARAVTELGKLVLLAMKHLPYAADPLKSLEELVPLMAQVIRAPNGLSALSAVMRYTLTVTEVEVPDLRRLVTTHVNPTIGAATMSTADRLIEQGRAEGRAEALKTADRLIEQGRAEALSTADRLIEQGRAEAFSKGRSDVLLKLLRARFGELPEPAVARVLRGTDAELDRWTERIFSVASLDELLDLQPGGDP